MMPSEPTSTTIKGACCASVMFYNCSLLSADKKELSESFFVIMNIEHSHEAQ
jgi:hypothetical protein